MNRADVNVSSLDAVENIRQATPLFLLSAPRSGTTLLARLLHSHAAILMTNETAVFLQIRNMIVNSRRGSPAGILYGKQYTKLWADHLDGKARELIETFYARIIEIESRGPLAFWGEKHPHNADCLDMLQGKWPNARYIYLVRDPRDSALSIAAMNSKSFRDSLTNWKLFSDKYETFSRNLPAESYVLMKYEDLVADYQGQTRRCLNWLGLDIDEGVQRYLDSYKDVDAHKVAPLQRARGQVDPAHKRNYQDKSVFRWRTELNSRDQQFALDMVEEFIRTYGYPTDRPSLLERLGLRKGPDTLRTSEE